jgi:hypothetical protein
MTSPMVQTTTFGSGRRTGLAAMCAAMVECRARGIDARALVDDP